jgi:predicted RNase H-like nuclease (RuvC/YqgF family)
MRLREKALRKNVQHMRRKEEEVLKKEVELRARESEIEKRERELEEKERQIEEMERAVQEMQRLKKYSGGGSSTTPGTDLGNDSCIKNAGNSNNIFNKSIDRGFFTSPGGQNSSSGGG